MRAQRQNRSLSSNYRLLILIKQDIVWVEGNYFKALEGPRAIIKVLSVIVKKKSLSEIKEN